MYRIVVICALLLCAVGASAQEIYLDDVEVKGFSNFERANGKMAWTIIVIYDGARLELVFKKFENFIYWHDTLNAGDRLSVTGVLKHIRFRHHISNDVIGMWAIERGGVKNWIRKR